MLRGHLQDLALFTGSGITNVGAPTKIKKIVTSITLLWFALWFALARRNIKELLSLRPDYL